MGPESNVTEVLSAAARPVDDSLSVVEVSAGPEVLLSLVGDQIDEVLRLFGSVQADGPHAVLAAPCGRAAVGEARAAQTPAEQVRPSAEVVVGSRCPAATAAITAVAVVVVAAPVAASAEEVAEEAELAVGDGDDAGQDDQGTEHDGLERGIMSVTHRRSCERQPF